MNKEIKCILFFMKSDEFSSFAYNNKLLIIVYCLLSCEKQNLQKINNK